MPVEIDPAHAPAEPHARVWRYMDFTKFVCLLEMRALFFAAVGRLFGRDKYEGALPRRDAPARDRILRAAPEDAGAPGPGGGARDARGAAFVNSWTAFGYEMAALWALYVRSNQGVAVQSTFERLAQALDAGPDRVVRLGLVRYLDYEKDALPEKDVLSLLYHKRKSFEFEREVRAVVVDPGHAGREGLYVPADLDRLIERVYVSPDAEDWFLRLVSAVGRRYGLDKETLRSDLAADPVY